MTKVVILSALLVALTGPALACSTSSVRPNCVAEEVREATATTTQLPPSEPGWYEDIDFFEPRRDRYAEDDDRRYFTDEEWAAWEAYLVSPQREIDEAAMAAMSLEPSPPVEVRDYTNWEPGDLEPPLIGSY